MPEKFGKILIISGSPRKGNTEYILNKIYESIGGKSELILLRNKNIKHCTGCLYCDKHKKCAIKDDMQEICKKMTESDIFILGTPNYFDNVSGLMKDFIDRTNPFYETDRLKGKKMITIVVGGGKIKNSEKVGNQALKCFSYAHKLNFIGDYYFKGLNKDDIENDSKAVGVMDKIIKTLKNELQ
jgi:multimeric flavodoxin WrbA